MKQYFLLLLVTIIFSSCKDNQKTEEQENVKDPEVVSETTNNSTAQSNVIILDSLFTIDGLDRDRQIRLYLPKDYNQSNKRYPVIYMHDAQNLFDDATSYAGEWGIDESLNQLAMTSKLEFIVVGIDNGGKKRMNELSPWEHVQFGKAEGKEYMQFIVNQIKPWLDSTYRTLSDRENTLIMGSSMGGLISHYAIYEYPEVFSKAGIFSPSYWYSDDVFSFTKNNPLPKKSRIYLLVGNKEGDEMIDGARKMYEQIKTTDNPDNKTTLVIYPKGSHNEKFWREQFIPAIKWLSK